MILDLRLCDLLVGCAILIVLGGFVLCNVNARLRFTGIQQDYLTACMSNIIFVTTIMSRVLGVSLPYELVFAGSRSCIKAQWESTTVPSSTIKAAIAANNGDVEHVRDVALMGMPSALFNSASMLMPQSSATSASMVKSSGLSNEQRSTAWSVAGSVLFAGGSRHVVNGESFSQSESMASSFEKHSPVAKYAFAISPHDVIFRRGVELLGRSIL